MKIGDVAPNFSLLADDGSRVSLSDFRGVRHVVVFFYPKDDTPSWTKQCCGFRDAYQDFIDNDAEVLGVSSDSRHSHQLFAKKNKLPYRLLVDTGGVLRTLWNVPKKMWVKPGRVTYVIDKNGVVIDIFQSNFNMEKHVSNALRVIRKNS